MAADTHGMEMRCASVRFADAVSVDTSSFTFLMLILVRCK